MSLPDSLREMASELENTGYGTRIEEAAAHVDRLIASLRKCLRYANMGFDVEGGYDEHHNAAADATDEAEALIEELTGQ